MKKYSKKDAIKVSKEFIKRVNELEIEFGLSFNSDTEDIYLSFKNDNDEWSYIKLGWDGDGSGIKVKEKDEEYYKKKALSKLSKKEKVALGLI